MAATDISDDDIVFECPSCGQSMAIDQRGAGMVIPCKRCGQEVKVPLRREKLSDQEKLDATEFKLSRLSASIKNLQQQQRDLAGMKTENDQRRKELEQEIQKLQDALKSASS